MKWTVVFLLAAATLAAFCRPKPDSGFAVVELFTSEGCSSCPPADHVLEQLDKQYPGKVLAMGFHVTYWDRLGWKDRFSDAAYTARQEDYARLMALKTIYTPQAVVNGASETVGSDKTRMEALVKTALLTPVTVGLEGQVDQDGLGHWTIHYQVDRPGLAVEAALVQRWAKTDVQGGENDGRQLDHINIVRALGTGVANTITLNYDIKPRDARLFLWAQDTATGHILKATELQLH